MANLNLYEIFKSNGAKVNHSNFDLNKRIAFSLPCSYIRPIYSAPTIPNEHHKIDFTGIMRTETMNTAAFANGKVHVNFFFVPYSQLWHGFNQFVTQKHDKHSVRFQGTNFVPNVSLYHLVYDHLRLLALRPDYAANEGPDAFYDQFHFNRFTGACALLQVFGYGNFYWMHGRSDNEITAHLQTLFGTFDSDGWHLTKDKYVNLFPILAYQHIWYDYYRDNIYDDRTFDGNEYVTTFNLDNVVCNTVTDSHFTLTDNQFAQIFECHNVKYKKDLFTSLMPSTQFGAVSGVEFDTLDLSNLDGDYPTLANSDGLWTTYDLRVQNAGAFDTSNAASNNFSDVDGAAADFISNGKASFDVLSLRRAQLLQRWKQNALRAGNMVDDNFMSHFGVKPYYEDDNNVRFLGSFSADMNINPVTATATTNDAVNGKVGDLAAIGVGSFSGKEIDFQCNDYGCIVGVAAFLPDVSYNANGIHKENTLIEPFDYPNPEFNNVGFEPISAWNLSLEYGNTRNVDDNAVMGFGSPWSYLKTNIDEVYDEFSSFQVTPSVKWQGSLTSWIFKRFADTTNVNGLSFRLKKTLYVNPHVTDSIFGIEYDGTNATNPFLFSCNVNHRAIRPLSVLGLPEF